MATGGKINEEKYGHYMIKIILMLNVLAVTASAGWRMEYSEGTSLKTPPGTIWTAKIPSKPGHINMVTREAWWGKDAPDALAITFKVVADNARYGAHPKDCTLQPSFRFYIQREGDNWSCNDDYASYRWWSNPTSYEFGSNDNQERTLTVNVKPGEWYNCWGSNGTEKPDLFWKAFRNADRVGVVFGCGGGHGAWVKSGTAKLRVFKFKAPKPKPTPTPAATPTPTLAPTPNPTPTATPKPTATPTPPSTPTPVPPTPTPTPTASPTVTPTPASVKRPRGTMYLLDRNFNDTAGFTNDAMDGVRLRMGWNEVQPSVGAPYDWSKPDRALDNAQKNGKQIGMGFAALSDEANPAGLEAAGCQMVDLSSGRVPWVNDPKFLELYGKFVADQGARYDGKVDYIVMGALGLKNFESHIANNSEDQAALDALGGLPKIQEAHKKIAQFFHNAFPKTRFIYTAANYYSNDAGMKALEETIAYLAPLYGELFGLQNCTLNARSNVSQPINAVVNKYAATNSCGLQFLTNCETGFGGVTCNGTLEETLNAGLPILKNRGYIEVYPKDANNPANAQLFKDTSEKLK